MKLTANKPDEKPEPEPEIALYTEMSEGVPGAVRFVAVRTDLPDEPKVVLLTVHPTRNAERWYELIGKNTDLFPFPHHTNGQIRFVGDEL